MCNKLRHEWKCGTCKRNLPSKAMATSETCTDCLAKTEDTSKKAELTRKRVEHVLLDIEETINDQQIGYGSLTFTFNFKDGLLADYHYRRDVTCPLTMIK